jgi:hypothetical protein
VQTVHENKQYSITADKAELLLEEFLCSSDLNEAVHCIQDLNSKEYYPSLVQTAICMAAEKKERDRREMIQLLNHLYISGTLSAKDFASG